ncbi:MAG: sulfatase-like hydrolase/transferase [Muribaculaceae bacterium]
MEKCFLPMLTLCMGGSTLYASNPQGRMNIVLIMADDFGYECIGANGGNYNTPNVNRLAEEGIRFEHCHSNPLSTPSRVQLMTGKYNVHNYISFGQLDRGETTFGNLLREAGYATCIAGKWQLGKEKDSPKHFGFDRSCLWQQTKGAVDDNGHDTRYANPVMDVDGETIEYPQGTFGPDISCDFVLDFIREHKDSPFFVYYPMALTHCPFVSTPDSEDWRAMRSPTYKGNAVHFPDMVEYTDKLVGRVLKQLDDLHLRDNTLVIFTGDNGTDSPVVTMLNGKPYPGGKGKTIDSGTHVPLFVSCPKGERGKVNSQLIDFTDFLPTLCEAAGIDRPSDPAVDGKSFYRQLYGKKKGVREWIYCWYAPRKVFDDQAAVFARNHKYKLYRTGEFYDVENDFYEKSPIAEPDMDKAQKKVFKTLQAVINRYEGAAKKKK